MKVEMVYLLCFFFFFILFLFNNKGVAFYNNKIYDRFNKCVESNRSLKERDTFTMILDLNKSDPKQRTLHFFINYHHLNLCFIDLPEEVTFEVFSLFSLYF